MVAPRAAAARRRAERAARSCSTTSASRSSGATAPTSRRRTSTGSPPTVCGSSNFHTTALCSPTRSCLLTGRNHHSNGMGRVADLAIGLPRLLRRHPPRQRLPLGDPARARGTRRTPSGKWHLTPDDETHMAGDRSTLAARARASTAGTGSTAARPTSSCPRCTATTTRSSRRGTIDDGLPPERGPRRPRDRVPVRSAQRRSGPTVLLLLRDRRVPLAAPRAARVDRALPRAVRRRVGRLARAHAPRGSSELGIIPPGTRAVTAARRGCRRGTTCTSPTRRSPPGSWSASPRSSRTPTTQIGRVLDFLEETGDLDDTMIVLVSDNGASAEGGAHGSINDVRLMNTDAAGRKEMRARIDELGGPTLHNNYPWGWTMAGNTPFRRWKREVHEGGVADPCIVRWPARASRTRAAAVASAAVRARDRRVPHHARARRASTHPPSIGGVAQRAGRGHELRVRSSPTTRPTRPSSTTRSTSRCSAPAAIYHRGLEGGDVQVARHSTPAGTRLRHAVRRRRVGAVPRRRGPLGDTRPRARRARSTRRARRPLVGTGARATRCSRSATASLDAILNPRPRRRARSTRSTCTARSARRCPRASR